MMLSNSSGKHRNNSENDSNDHTYKSKEVNGQFNTAQTNGKSNGELSHLKKKESNGKISATRSKKASNGRLENFRNTHTSDEENEWSDEEKASDLESSGVFVAGYTGPIHKWEHPGYEFLNESSKVTSSTVERLYKIIVVGDATVGKTTFVQRYVNDYFLQDYKGTVGVDFSLKVLWKSKKEVIKLQLWDIAGQERFTWMTRVYYRDAQGCIVMFDLGKRSTFLSAMKWKKDVDSKCQMADGSPLPAILLGNKCDLPQRDVNQDEIEYAFKTGDYVGWTEVSAKEGLMVDDCMKFLVDIILSKERGKVSTNDVYLKELAAEKVQLTKKPKQRTCCT